MRKHWSQLYHRHIVFLLFSDSPISVVGKATNIIKDFFKQKSVTRFRPYDVQDLLQPLIPCQPQTASADQVQQWNPLSVWWWNQKENLDKKAAFEVSLCVNEVSKRSWDVTPSVEACLYSFMGHVIHSSRGHHTEVFPCSSILRAEHSGGLKV